MILAEMWRKKMEAMKERERTRTMKGSLYETGAIVQHNAKKGWGNAGNAGREGGRQWKWTYTRSPGESSV